MRVRSILVATFACGTWMGLATAAADSLTCAQAYEKAQEERAAGRLNAAIEDLRSCIDSSCAKFIRDDCLRWMNQTEGALPTVVFSVCEDAKDLTSVEILCDGKLLTGTLDGKALPIDPGLHNLTFKVPGLPPVDRQLLIREGERNRIIEVEFRSPHDSTPPVPAVTTESAAGTGADGNAKSRYLTYGLASLGALAVGGFTLFAVLGNSQQRDLEKSCAPYCQSSQVDSVRTKYLIADTCLGVGLISLGVATYVYISNRGKKSDTPDRRGTISVELVPQSVGSGSVLQLSTVF